MLRSLVETLHPAIGSSCRETLHPAIGHYWRETISLPRETAWVENNTGPLLPPLEEGEEPNYMLTNAHLSRAGNLKLLGTDNRFGKSDWVLGSPEDTLNQPEDYSWVDKLATSLTSPIPPEPWRQLPLLQCRQEEQEEKEFEVTLSPLMKFQGLMEEAKAQKKQKKLQPPDFLECLSYYDQKEESKSQVDTPAFNSYMEIVEKARAKQPKIKLESAVIDVDLILRNMEKKSEEPFWKKQLKDGSLLIGATGGETHVHDYDQLGIGHVKIQSSGKKYPFNNFNETVEAQMPDWMLDPPKPKAPSIFRQSMYKMCIKNGWDWEIDADGYVQVKY